MSAYVLTFLLGVIAGTAGTFYVLNKVGSALKIDQSFTP